MFRGAERTYSFSLRYEPGLGTDGGLNYEYKGEGYNLAMVTLSLTPHYTVRYDANGGAGYIPEDNATHESGGSVDVLFDHVPSRPGYEFLGWARSSTAAEAEFTASGARSFSIYSDTTLYAVWSAGAPVLSIGKAVYLVDADGPGRSARRRRSASTTCSSTPSPSETAAARRRAPSSATPGFRPTSR